MKKSTIIAAIAAISVVTMVVYVNKLRKDSYCAQNSESTTGWCLGWQKDNPVRHAANLQKEKELREEGLAWERRNAEKAKQDELLKKRIEITITGPSGSGKSTAFLVVLPGLQASGLEVSGDDGSEVFVSDIGQHVRPIMIRASK